MEDLNRDNLKLFLAAFMEQQDLDARRIAKAIGCSESTIKRILANESQPTDELIKQVGVMITVGFEPYSKLSEAERKDISEKLGTLGGGVLGFGTITAAVSKLGLVAGLSGPGIASGLAALGKLIGGGMIAGVSVAAAIPIAAGTLGWIVIKGVKYFASEHELNSLELNPRWEEERPLGPET